MSLDEYWNALSQLLISLAYRIFKLDKVGYKSKFFIIR